MKGLVRIMRFKYYIRGFGTGVLFATVMLMVTLAIQNNMPSDKGKGTNTSGNLILENKPDASTKEKENDMTTKPDATAGDETTIPENSSDTQTTPTVPEETTTPEETSPQQTTTLPAETTTLETTAIPEPSTSAAEPGSDAGTVFTLSITSGMTSNKVADILAAQGLVDSAYEFNMYLHEHGYSSKLRVGSYEIKSGMSYEEIAEILTRK